MGNLLLILVSHVGAKMTESFAENTVRRVRTLKPAKEESKLLQGSTLKSTTY